MKTQSFSTEVTIAGGGIAGLVTAYHLLERDKKVILFDRDSPENLGGLAKESFGGIFFVNTKEQQRFGIQDSPELAFRDWCSFAEFDNSDMWGKKWAKIYVESSKDLVYSWLKEIGVTFMPVVHWVERGLFKPGNSVPRFHMVWGTGSELIKLITEKLFSHSNAGNLKIEYHCKVEEIQLKNGYVTGITGINEKTGEKFSSDSDVTVIASGGIQGNLEKVRQNWYNKWGNPPKKLLNGSHRFATGELHDAVEKIDGNITSLDRMWLYAAGVHHPNPNKPFHGLSLVPPKSALWLNSRGERIGPVPLMTAFDTRYIVEQICKQEEKYSWQIMNQKIAMKELAVSGSEYNDSIRDKKMLAFLKTLLLGNRKLVTTLTDNCIDFVTANTIEELAEKMNSLTGNNNIEISTLQNSILNYDQVIDRGEKYFNDEQLRRIVHVRQYKGDRMRTCKYQKIFDRKVLPLIAVREFILTRKSLGGIQTNLDSQVLSVPKNGSQQVINGLYAVGEAAGFGGGGIHGIRALEGTFLGSCILTGRIAAEKIAKGL
jgi:predicted oxidoreductase